MTDLSSPLIQDACRGFFNFIGMLKLKIIITILY